MLLSCSAAALHVGQPKGCTAVHTVTRYNAQLIPLMLAAARLCACHLLCSGAGLLVGDSEGYKATDIVARYKRMRPNRLPSRLCCSGRLPVISSKLSAALQWRWPAREPSPGGGAGWQHSHRHHRATSACAASTHLLMLLVQLPLVLQWRWPARGSP